MYSVIQFLEEGAVRALVDDAVDCVITIGTVDGWAQKCSRFSKWLKTFNRFQFRDSCELHNSDLKFLV